MRSSALGTSLFLVVLGVVSAVLGGASSARAFSGFYASRGGAPPTMGASTVVLMRDGDRTVVSMRSDYRGPPEDFALIVPVPEPIGREQVRTLRHDAFDRIERLSAPRLVEFWERDPCATPGPTRASGSGGRARGGGGGNAMRPPPATVEARFAVGEYDVVILGAADSAGLGRWLRERGYRMPPGAAAAVRAYIEAGCRFLVARVDASRLTFEDGRATPSPIRFHYRSEDLVLPVRLGRVGARGAQDLVIHVLAREHRYEVANRVNVLAPTNLVMYPSARQRFDEVYATILHRVLERHPGAVVTEYAWGAQSCAPCPTVALGATDLDTFGLDVIDPARRSSGEGFVLTRLRARIDERTDSDLVLRPAAPIAGGRGRPRGSGASGGLGRRIDRRATANAFQARYAILHPWNRPTTCASPRRGRWGAPPRLRRPAAIPARPTMTTIALGRLRRFLQTWAPVLRIPSRGDALPATER